MKLTEAKYLEYSINVFKEFFEERESAKMPTYKILWKRNNKLFFADTLKFDEDYYVLKPHIHSDLSTTNNRINVDTPDSFPADIRRVCFDNYLNKPDSHPDNLYKHPYALLKEMINFVNTIEKNIDDPEYRLLNVSYLGTDIKIPFLLVEKDFELEPVSLIKVSKN